MPFPFYILRPLVFTVSILMVEWGVFPTLFVFIAVLSLLGTGLKRSCFKWEFSKSLFSVTSIVLFSMALCALMTRTFNLPESPLWIIVYLPWSLLQGFIVFCFIYESLEKVTGEPYLRVLVAGIFSIFHIPNIFLVVSTFLMILLFSTYYSKYRTILFPALLHSILAIFAMLFLPEGITHALKVGINCCR